MTHPVDRHLRRLTTPKAAAFAGVLFALLFGAALVLIRTALARRCRARYSSGRTGQATGCGSPSC